MHGEGIKKFANGKVMEGQWKLNEMHGMGAITLPDGGMWSGLFKREKFVSED